MWQTLRDNPEVVWGFLLALGVVLILTPAVGRFARILGVVDQPGEARRIHLRPIPQLGGQVTAAAVAVGSGVEVDRFTFPFLGIQDLPAWVGVPATLIWIVAIMNMVNFLDGMDGLAAGICAIAGSTFAVIALSLGAADAALLAAIVAGACFGFLHHNFYPARIFMGDSGALLLGFLLA